MATETGSENIKLEDNTKEVTEAFKKQVKLGLDAIGLTAEGYAKVDCPVDTGRLRNSISYAVKDKENSVYIGTNVEYARAVEYRDNEHHTVGKAHFLRDSATQHGDEYKQLMEMALKK